MGALIALLLVAVALPAGAVSKKKACLQACAGTIDACTARNQDLGDLAGGCRKAILTRCKQQGPAACAAFCGNGSIDAGEACDGPNLQDATCRRLGFPGGTVACTAGCTLDLGGCLAALIAPPSCGNGEAEPGEACDGVDLRSHTCEGDGFLGGTLACDASCQLDTSGCIAEPPVSTTLLVPFVTNQQGLDTGIVISNTTADPFGTEAKEGTCTLRFSNAAGGTAPASQTTANIAAGRQSVMLVSTIAPGFRGQIFADCAFPLARAFAFISDIGARNLAETSDAEVVPVGGENLGSPPTDVTNLLFTYVINQAGFDTTVFISNTGSGGPAGCTFDYFSGSGTNPATQTSNPLAPGEQLSFTLSGGGDHGIDARPGFLGYIIASCGFPGARGRGFLSDLGMRNLSTNVPVEVIPAGDRR